MVYILVHDTTTLVLNHNNRIKNNRIEKWMASCLVFGATGATGRAVVQELLSGRSDVGRVITIGRRGIDDDVKSTLDGTRLEEVVVESLDCLKGRDGHDTIAENVKERVLAQGPVDIAYCCLGTTRGVAGSADAFRKVDVEYVDISASFAKSCGVKVFGLISAQGASKTIWASDWKPFHGLLYTKCKGLAEECVLKQGFRSTILMRPGLLDREESARFGERMFRGILPTIKTRDLARVMINQSMLAQQEPVKIFEMKEIQRQSRQNE